MRGGGPGHAGRASKGSSDPTRTQSPSLTRHQHSRYWSKSRSQCNEDSRQGKYLYNSHRVSQRVNECLGKVTMLTDTHNLLLS